MNEEHHKKWLLFADNMGVAITNLSLFGVEDLEQLHVKYKADEHLNNIPLRIFDSLWICAQQYVRDNLKAINEYWCLYQGACMYKALLRQLLIDNHLI